MTVKNKNLVDLLSQKTGLEQKEAEDRLRQLVEYIETEIQKSEACSIGGLGTFNLRNDKLDFEADDDLALEINYKYAGMKPIELIGAYKDLPDASVIPPVDVDVTESEEEDEKLPETVPEEPVSGVEKLETEADPVAEEDTEQSESVADVKPGEVSTGIDKNLEPESEPEEEHILRTEDKPKTETKISSSDASEEWKPKSKFRQREKDTDSIGKWLVAAVIVIALGLSGWLVYDMGLLNGGTNETASNVSESPSVEKLEPGTDPNGDGAALDPSGAEDLDVNEDPAVADNESEQSTSEQDGQNRTSSVASIAEESRQSVYGLRGGATPEVNDGYTIVIHSMRNEVRIRRVNTELQQQGYRTIVFGAEVMDTTFWRLGLGQFKTVEDALKAAATLPEAYRQNHFIKRIQ